jgi:pimeloyl-ACP methyl ester carboxylesterase
LGAAALLAAEQPPLLVFVPGGARTEAPRMAGWEALTVPAGPNDAGVSALEAAIQAARHDRPSDPLRTYLVGQGEGAATVFYAVSRRPDLWAAALALGGTPKPAIDSNRLYGANTELAPMMWVTPAADRALLEPLRARLAAAHFNLEPAPAGISIEQAFQWLASHTRPAFPKKVDCETGNTAFARCYWVEMAKFDAKQRNDALLSTRVPAGSGAALSLGGFGYKPDAPGPGVVVEWLPEKYKGPLQLGDRIVELAGKEIRDGRQYAETMDQTTEEKPVAIMLERAKERRRVETRIVVPKRAELVTVRVQAQFLADSRELLVITRGVTELRVTLPDYWVPCPINWNGNQAGQADSAGCWLLATDSPARKCD